MVELEQIVVPTTVGATRTVEMGRGQETVFLIHGFGGDAENWRFNIAALARSRRVVAIDLPGHGETTNEVGSGELNVLVQTVAEVVESRAVGPVHLVGHSLGGLVAAEVALRQPQRYPSLALIAPAGFGRPANYRYVRGFTDAQTHDEMNVVLKLLFARKDFVTGRLVDQVLESKSRDGTQVALDAIAAWLTGDTYRVDIEGLTNSGIKTMFIWGAEDEVIPSPNSDDQITGVPLALLPNVGHSPHVEVAKTVNRLLIDFHDGTADSEVLPAK